MNNILLPLAVWFDWKKAKDFVFGSSILGGLAVVLYPVGVLFGDPIVLTFPMLRTLLVHFLLIFLPCYLIREGTFRFEIEHWPRVLVGTVLAHGLGDVRQPLRRSRRQLYVFDGQSVLWRTDSPCSIKFRPASISYLFLTSLSASLGVCYWLSASPATPIRPAKRNLYKQKRFRLVNLFHC
ncbi:MAG: hypothetical protein MZU97_03790 [Bacillus subtilis]|nr:hypothetical protein [Bacillus subtilis]